jgi:hypothetical protein
LLEEEKRIWSLTGQENLKRGKREHILNTNDQGLGRRRLYMRD